MGARPHRTPVRSLPLEGSQLSRLIDQLEEAAVRSLPLEGSQREAEKWVPIHVPRFAHYPWRDRNPPARPEWTRRRPRFAHYPWRDRNHPHRYRYRATPGRVRSLPLEGSQQARELAGLFLLGFAHYPWRDRNPASDPTRDVAPGVRSLPLEGSQRHRPAQAPYGPQVRSLPLEGSQRHRPAQAPYGPQVRSLPLEGSQPSTLK